MLSLTGNLGQNALVEASNHVSEPKAVESSSDDSSGSENWVKEGFLKVSYGNGPQSVGLPSLVYIK